MGKTAQIMNNNKNTRVSRAQALAVVAYLMYSTDYFFTLDVAENRCEISIFTHSGAELVSIESELRPFIVDGCTTQSHKLPETGCVTYDITFPCVYTNAY